MWNEGALGCTQRRKVDQGNRARGVGNDERGEGSLGTNAAVESTW